LSLFFYPDIYNKLYSMIKQTWEVSNEERNRILSLHESATKNHYLMSEQLDGDPRLMHGQESGEDTWRLCSYTIIKKGANYYIQTNKGELKKLPLASQITATIDPKKGQGLYFPEDVMTGIRMGLYMKYRNEYIDDPNFEGTIAGPCHNVVPAQYDPTRIYKGVGGSWFVFIDDLGRYFDEPTPVFSILTWNGDYGSASAPVLEQLKNRKGVVIQYAKSYTPKHILGIGYAFGGRKEEPITPEIPPTTTPEFEEIKLDIQSPFEFDKTTLTPDAEIEFKKFVEKIKLNYQGVSGNVEVIASASIDGDENQKRDYNQKLSDNRASTIANRLKTETGISTLNFIPKGIGQTDQFAKGMKYPEVKDVNKTAPNRRLIIKMPTITKEKQ
jgi:outer membrane protein OmpA-like peptidoglycan-associated protein